ncbi:unnamed protein product [Brassica oleracea var. botrytis]
MIGQSFFPEDLDCGNFFDNMDDILDFPGGDIDVGFDIGESDSFPNIWTTHHDTWPPASDPLFSSNTNTNSDSSPELYVPFEDIVKVERPPSLIEKKEDSFSTNMDSSSSYSTFRSSSPVSVLESSSSSSQTTNTTSLVLPGKQGRPRTKRPRPHLHEKDGVKDIVDSCLIVRIPKQFVSDHSKMITKKKKKKKAKVTSSSSSSGIDLEVNGNSNVDSYSSDQNPVRKCMHCEVTKTPQWRLGPNGPKTLCNACGVRYKSGRLFPEYRPAASPTFTPALHSNSHKKVAEMRSKRCKDGSYTTEENDMQDLIPNNAYTGVDLKPRER